MSVDCSLSVYKVDSVTDGRGGRLTKEEKTYVQEAAEQAARVERFLAEGRDEWDIKKQVGFVPTSPPIWYRCCVAKRGAILAERSVR